MATQNTITISVKGKNYNVFIIDEDEYKNGYGDPGKLIGNVSKTKGNNVVIRKSNGNILSDILNDTEKNEVLTYIEENPTHLID